MKHNGCKNHVVLITTAVRRACGFLCQGTSLVHSRTKAKHSNLCDTFALLPEFSLHIPQLWPRISAKIYLPNQGDWLEGRRQSQIKQKDSNQVP